MNISPLCPFNWTQIELVILGKENREVCQQYELVAPCVVQVAALKDNIPTLRERKKKIQQVTSSPPFSSEETGWQADWQSRQIYTPGTDRKCSLDRY